MIAALIVLAWSAALFLAALALALCRVAAAADQRDARARFQLAHPGEAYDPVRAQFEAESA